MRWRDSRSEALTRRIDGVENNGKTSGGTSALAAAVGRFEMGLLYVRTRRIGLGAKEFGVSSAVRGRGGIKFGEIENSLCHCERRNLLKSKRIEGRKRKLNQIGKIK